MAGVHAAQTMNANDKGSLVNRTKCAGEHLKNDLKTGLKVGLVSTLTAGAGMAAYHSPAACVKVTGKAGQGVATIGKWLGKLNLGKTFAKAANNLEKFGGKIMEKAPKYGKFAVLAGIGVLAMSAFTRIAKKQGYNEGKIDQKYEDNAKIEKMTGSIVV